MAQEFSKGLRWSISALPGQGLKDVFSFHMSPWSTCFIWVMASVGLS